MRTKKKKLNWIIKKNIKFRHYYHWNFIGAYDFDYLSYTCNEIKSISFASTGFGNAWNFCTEAGIIEITEQCKNLTSLSLGNNIALVTNNVILKLTEKCNIQKKILD